MGYAGRFSQLGTVIHDERKKRNLTQSEFLGKLANAEHEVNIGRNRLSDLENGTPKKGSDLDILRACTEVFECDYGYLFGEIDAPTQSAQYIVDETNLSIDAVSLLQSKKYSDIISAFITHPEFLKMCDHIRQLQDKEGLHNAQIRVTVDGIWARGFEGKPFPEVDVFLALYTGAKDCFNRILDSIVEEEK